MKWGYFLGNRHGKANNKTEVTDAKLEVEQMKTEAAQIELGIDQMKVEVAETKLRMERMNSRLVRLVRDTVLSNFDTTSLNNNVEEKDMKTNKISRKK